MLKSVVRAMLNEWLAFWLQAAALILVLCAYVATAFWVASMDATDPRGRVGSIHAVAHDTLTLHLPIPITYLGVRFLWRFRRGNGIASTITYTGIAILLFVVVSMAVLTRFSAVQRVREATSSSFVDDAPR